MRSHAKPDDHGPHRREVLASGSQRLGLDRRGIERRWRPRLEGLEPRDLLSTVLPEIARVDSGFVPNPAVIQQSINLLYGPNSPTPITPTPREVKRETFAARWLGNYAIGPPTFLDRASTIHAWSKSGGSNQFLKGKLQMELFPPANPTAAPSPGDPFANRVTGLAALTPQNFLQSSATLLLDLDATAGMGSTKSGLPTRLSWTYDPSSAGAYTVPALFTQGTGTLDIKWIPDAHPLPHTLGSGTMIVTFQGLINTSGIISSVSRSYS